MSFNESPALILMSTYQGAAYLAAQLDSIRHQHYQHWHLIIRDDGSTDDTNAIIEHYCQLDSRITCDRSISDNLGAAQSFAALMQVALTRKEQIICFCDQDDVWLPNKLQAQVTTMLSMQQRYGHNVPLLVHSDLCVVNEQLQVIAPSYLAYEGIKRNVTSPLNTLLINNFVTGCTIAMNRQLLEIATPMPQEVFMHDWWCALCAATQGIIGFIKEPVILYRQHRHNTIGSQGVYSKFKELRQLKAALAKRHKNLRLCFKQASHLVQRIDDAHHSHAFITRFQSLPQLPVWRRYLHALKLPLQPSGWLRTLMFWTLLGTLVNKPTKIR